jgi:hypothetical protein
MMTSRYRAPIGILLIVALFQIAGSARADIINVFNPSFESQPLANGDLTLPVADWTYWTSLGGVGVVYNPLGYDAPDNDTTLGFIGASGNGTPQGADGPNVAWQYMPAYQYGAFQQVLDTTLQAGHTYTLTAAVGMVPGGGNVDAELWFTVEDEPGSLAKLWKYALVTPTTPGVFEDKTLTYTPTEEDIALYSGQKLAIGLCAASFNEITGRVAFDNVRVTEVPEPCSLCLLASGLVGLVAYTRRRRN